jgi:cleavage and polyadenylation specificity factor subunit 3
MEDIMSFTPLGSGQEVGRSCHVLEFRGMNIMLDIGIHPGYDGLNGLPFLDRIEPDQIDVLLVTHFHLDHAASLPYLTERTNFKGRIFMTNPTKAVLRLLLGDYLRLLDMRNSDNILYTEADLAKCIDKIELIDYHTTVSVGGLNFYALNAGHVLGACMYWLDIGGRTILYTGDYSMEQDRHLMAAELPHSNIKPDLLITESTYGVQVHASRAEREARFTTTIERVVTRGGKCLIPVFALGRAQELLLILDEYWHANPKLHHIPIWYASKLASRALRVYQTYANMMNARIRAQMDVCNPFHFRYIQNLKSINVHDFDDSRASVVFASPGMLQSGVSRQLFDRWAADPKNGVLIAGYAVEHTMAKEIMSQPKEVVTLEGRRQPLNCLVDYVSFSAHVDFVQNRSFITQVAPRHVILVHGQKDEMGRLKSALLLQYKQYPENKRPTITMPPNLQVVKLKFPRRRSAKVMGSLASEAPTEGESVNGILVTHNFNSKIVAPQDLQTYTPLRQGEITSKLHVPFAGSVDTIRLFLKEMYASVTELTVGNFTLGPVTLTVEDKSVIVEWMASPAGDVLADSVVALLMHAQSSAASIRLTSKPCCGKRRDDETDVTEQEDASKKQKTDTYERLRLIHQTLRDQYQNVEAIYEEPNATYEIVTDGDKVTVKVEMQDDTTAKVSVESAEEKLASNVQDCIRNLLAATAPIQVNTSK